MVDVHSIVFDTITGFFVVLHSSSSSSSSYSVGISREPSIQLPKENAEKNEFLSVVRAARRANENIPRAAADRPP
ncbi:uncharacterized protein MONOS_12544 [Monocercomonoides exilis]|uniref:uncharacterized protein n=1 Tax=Monocercomonoides exilis TaxID=2049356 RepID=UPI00355A81D8|nr:hypothetical protein MONOS_12544 [Monocercomonoides exilis]|eukprot:MONOS_12544.1-p1 / transcript=MONOS_12544.1 / gene=MONOS_12544 / organism=Monocercomonoides_exilis_PA203 / gene_product=unspecified product / transcript_product=unspecified product / location=Mono_scaffold00700:20420-20644(-) / protein_length=75 / sequence_SO=supercontig / SO=protein_coding / is_pseudo=false